MPWNNGRQRGATLAAPRAVTAPRRPATGGKGPGPRGPWGGRRRAGRHWAAGGPDLDGADRRGCRLMQAQALRPRRPALRPRQRAAWLGLIGAGRPSPSGSAAASTACSPTSKASCCASAPIPTGPRPACTGTCPGRSSASSRPPSPASTAPRSASASGPRPDSSEPATRFRRPRGAGRKPDADRRREHHRHRCRGLLADQATPAPSCSTPRNPEDLVRARGRKLDARGDRPHADPAGADRSARARSKRTC